MRKDEEGNQVPSTLGEYRDLCAVVGIDNNAAVALLDRKIASNPRGRDEGVVESDLQMRRLLMPLLAKEDALTEYKRLFKQLDELCSAGKRESEEADLLRNSMDRPWYEMSDEERRDARSYVARFDKQNPSPERDKE